jgi:hypothetical protein
VRAGDGVAAELLAAFPDVGSGSIYIVDPLGNLMMRHAPSVGLSQDLLADLRKLLKLSHIG